jgi:hypothetical protein
MTKPELKLASILLSRAANEFGNHGCNDFMKEDYEDLTEESIISLTNSISDWNSNDPTDRMTPYHVPDFMLMDYLADRLKEESEK